MKYPKMAVFLIIVFFSIFLVDTFFLNGLLLQWGTLNNEKVFLNNQWWRVITAPLFHFGVIHIFANSLATYCTGILIESKIKSTWFLLIFMVSNTLERIIFVFIFSPGSSVGSSPGIFGLIGVIVIYCIRNKSFFIEHIKSREMEYLIGYGILGNILFVNSLVDIIERLFVHAVGFIIGVMLGVILNLTPKEKILKNTSV
ncbi:rhomboid family intramembrane serine protease [Paenibacillus lautus]|uniref:rhomboid family intramembrane serine protease n=1 Tax=Paenibacillus lautus TaxID=1401 RepID=UPI003D2852CC